MSSILVSAIGSVLIYKKVRYASIIDRMLISVDGELAIVAKPSTELAIWLSIFISLLLALPIALAAQAITATLLQTDLEPPYRQSKPLRGNVPKSE